jgi:hypothetical protein
MRIRELGRILQPALIAIVAIAITASRGSLAADETPPSPHSDAVLGDPKEVGESSIAQERYSSILIGPLQMGFTKGFFAKDRQRKRRIRGADAERMQKTYRKVVRSRLASDYAISETAGLGVVRAEAFLIDHVLDKRDWLAPVTTSFRSAPAVRIVVFLRDSRSNELIHSVGLTLPPRANRLMKDGPGSYWSYMRLVFDRVATRMHWALENGASES